MVRRLCRKLPVLAAYAVCALGFLGLLGVASGTAVAGPLAVHKVADESPSDGDRYGEQGDEADGSAQRQPDEGQSSEDGTGAEPDTGSAVPDAPEGCRFRDGPLELFV